MDFPELKLFKLEKELLKKEEKENNEIADKYNINEVKITGSDKILNRIYPGIKVKQRSYTINDYIIIKHNDKYYVVMRIRTVKNGNIFYKPLVFDLNMLETIRGDNLTWSLANRYPALKGKHPFLHNFIKNHKPKKEDKGYFSYDHLNRIVLDNRLCNLEYKSQSLQNKNQKIRKIGSKKLAKIPEPYRSYYINNRPRYIYWYYEKTHGHRIAVNSVCGIKEKRFSSKNHEKIPELMKKAENYLLEESKKLNLNISQISSEFSSEINKIKNDYYQICLKASKFFDLNIN
jgi:hypothetical protein